MMDVVENIGRVLLDDGTLNWASRSALRLVAAALFGAVIGLEREHSGRSAGMRTQLLVALGSALAMLVSLQFATKFAYQSAGGVVNVDPARVAYGVMGGIGFIGAGAILRYGSGIRGLTTAASLWCTAAVGLACGFGMYLLAAITTVLVLFALIFLAKLEIIIPSRRFRKVTIVIPISDRDNFAHFKSKLTSLGVKVRETEYIKDKTKKLETLVFHIASPTRLSDTKLMSIDQGCPDLQRLSVQ